MTQPAQNLPMPTADVSAGTAEERKAPTPTQSAQPPGAAYASSALDAYRRRDDLVSVLEVSSPSNWWLFGALALALVLALGLACFGQVELTSRGRGAVRPEHEVQRVRTELAGRVEQAPVRSGAHVRAGDVLLKLDATPFAAAAERYAKELRSAQEQLMFFEGPENEVYLRSIELMEKQTTLIAQRIDNHRRDETRHARRVRTREGLRDRGLAAETEVDGLIDSLSSTQRDLLNLRERIIAVRLDIESLKRSRLARGAELKTAVDRAQALHSEAQRALALTVIRAPRAGTIEGMQLRPGDLVETGALVLRIVPDGTAETIVAFVPEKDRAFISKGTVARLELDQLPLGEFGSARARVVRVTNTISSLDEIREVLGAGSTLEGPHYRVDLALEHDRRSSELRARVAGSALVFVHFQLRKRRIVALAFDPLRRWLERP